MAIDYAGVYSQLAPSLGRTVLAPIAAPTAPKAITAQQVVGYQLGPISAGADSPLGQLMGALSGVGQAGIRGAQMAGTDFQQGLAFSNAHPQQAAQWVSQNAGALGANVGSFLGVGVNAIGSGAGGVAAGVGPGIGQGAAVLGAGIGSGVSQAGPGVGLGIGNAASGVGSGIASAAMNAGPGVGAGVGAAAAGIGTGLGSALPPAGAGAGIGAGASLSGLGSAVGNFLGNATGSGSFGLITIGLVALLAIILLAR